MAQHQFDTILNNVGPIPLVVQHAASDGALVIGATSTFNPVTATNPIRVTAFPNGGSPVIFKVTGASTANGQTTLIVAGAIEGTTDQLLVVGTNLFHNFTAGHLQDGYNAINALDLAVVHSSGNETVAGTKTFTTPPVVGSLTGMLKASGGGLSSGTPNVDFYAPGTLIPPSALASTNLDSSHFYAGDGTFRSVSGGSGNVSNGFYVVDVTPWIAANPTDHAAAVQACHDALLSSGSNTQATVLYMPSISGGYSFARPVLWGHGNAVIQGEKGATTINSTSEAFVIWQKYANADGVISPGHGTDLFGVLDASTVPATGQKYGVSTYANEVAINGSPTGGTFVLSYTLPYSASTYKTPAIPSSATASQIQTALGNFQALNAFGGPTSGSVTVTYTLPAASGGGTGTFTVPYNCSAASAQTLANAAFGSGNCTVTGGAWPSSALVFTFTLTYGAVPAMVVTANNLAGGNAPNASIFTLAGLVTCTGGPLPAAPVKYSFAAPMNFDVAPQLSCASNNLTGGATTPVPTRVQAGQNLVYSFHQVAACYPIAPASKWSGIRQLTVDIGASSPDWTHWGMSSPAAPAAPSGTVGGSGGALGAGTYQAYVTTVQNGLESYPSAGLQLTLTASGQVPTVNFAGGASPSGAYYNLYLSQAGQSNGLLYAGGVTAASVACSGAWQAASVQAPTSVRGVCGIAGFYDFVAAGPNPWLTRYDSLGGRLYLDVNLLATAQTATNEVGTTWSFSVPFTPSAGYHDVSWQVDLDAKTVQCWVDGAAMVVTGSTAWATGATFRENDGVSPLAIGYADQNGVESGGFSYRKSPNLTVCGLQVRSASRWQTVSNQQAFLSGVSVVDGTSHIYDKDRYYAGTSATMAMLPLTDAPGSLLLSYSYANQYGTIATEQHLAAHDESTANDWIGYVAVNDITFNSASKYGYAFCVGNAEGVHFNRCNFVGGGFNVGDINSGEHYVATYRDCNFFYGNQGVLYAWMGVHRLHDSQLVYPGKFNLRLAAASTVFAHGAYVSPQGGTDAVVKITHANNPNMFSFRDWQCDYEGGGPTYGYFLCDAANDSTYSYSLLLENFGFGTTTSGVPYVTLRGYGGAASNLTGTHTITVESCPVQTTTAGSVLVACHDDAWTGEVAAAPPGPYQYSAGPKGSVVSRHAMAAPPTGGAWDAGRSFIVNTSGSGGAGWTCTQSGDFAGTPPVFTAFGASSAGAAGSGSTDRITFLLAPNATLAAGTDLTVVGATVPAVATPLRWLAKAAVPSTSGSVVLDIVRAPMGTGTPTSIFAASPSGVVLPANTAAYASGTGFVNGLTLSPGDELTINCSAPGQDTQYVIVQLFNQIQAG